MYVCEHTFTFLSNKTSVRTMTVLFTPANTAPVPGTHTAVGLLSRVSPSSPAHLPGTHTAVGLWPRVSPPLSFGHWFQF